MSRRDGRILLLTIAGTLSVHLSRQDCDLLTDKTTYLPVPVVNKPDYLQAITDPTFGTTITRIVGDPGDPIPNIPGSVWAAEQERHGYSKVSAWNCDQSMIYLNRHYPNLWLDGETSSIILKHMDVPPLMASG